jgi:hypothetical protein
LLLAFAAAAAASAVAAPARPEALRSVAVPASPQSARFRVVVYGQNHTPRAGVRWRYAVRAVTRNGSRFNGTAIMRVVVGGKIVDTIGWFGFKGLLRKTYRFNPVLRGKRAILQAKVLGPGGSRIVGFVVRVR